MKVLLINPTSYAATSSKMFRTFLSPLPPQGIAYIAAVLERNGVDVSLLDQYALNLNNKRLVDMINKGGYNVVGFSCLTPNMSYVKKLVEDIRILNKEIKIVLGNTHATVFAEELLKDWTADFVVHGEGEYTMLELVSSLRDKKDLNHVKGISCRNNGRIIHNINREQINDLDELPYPAWHLLDIRYYKEVVLASLYGTAFPIQASRGCPYRCIFCAQEQIHKLPRYRKVETVVDEIEYMHKRFKVNMFGFNDAYFPFSFEHGMRFCDELIRRGLNKHIKWGTEMRVDQADERLLKKMKKAGVHIIMYGFESGNQGILNKARKTATVEHAYRAMRFTKKAGIMTLGFFVLGLPGETKESCSETIKFAKRLDCDTAKFNIAIPYPGSEFYEMCKHKLDSKIREPEKFTSWYDWSNLKGDLVYVPEGMTSSELLYFQRKAMFQFYVRPKIILRHIVRKSIPWKYLILGGFLLIHRILKSYFNRVKNR